VKSVRHEVPYCVLNRVPTIGGSEKYIVQAPERERQSKFTLFPRLVYLSNIRKRLQLPSVRLVPLGLMILIVQTYTSLVCLSSINESRERNEKALMQLLAIHSACGIFRDSPREKDRLAVTTTLVKLAGNGNVIYQIYIPTIQLYESMPGTTTPAVFCLQYGACVPIRRTAERGKCPV
jgi:hypothetical protein